MKAICFAYFGDGKFLGWYSDTFGSLTKDKPKVYIDMPHQRETISGNFIHKMKTGYMKVAEAIGGQNELAGSLMKSGLSKDEYFLSGYNKIELRIVPCPFYDGPNPDHDKTKPFDEKTNNHWIYCDRQKLRNWATSYGETAPEDFEGFFNAKS